MATLGHGASSWPPDRGKSSDLLPCFVNGPEDSFPPLRSDSNAAMDAITVELLPQQQGSGVPGRGSDEEGGGAGGELELAVNNDQMRCGGDRRDPEVIDGFRQSLDRDPTVIDGNGSWCSFDFRKVWPQRRRWGRCNGPGRRLGPKAALGAKGRAFGPVTSCDGLSECGGQWMQSYFLAMVLDLQTERG